MVAIADWLADSHAAELGPRERANGPSTNFSTRVPLEPDLDRAVGVNNDGHSIPVVQGLVEGLLGLVHPPFLVLDLLAAPRVAQAVAGGSNGEGIDDGNVGHGSLPALGTAILQWPHCAVITIAGDSPAALFPAPTLSGHTLADIIGVCLRVQFSRPCSPEGQRGGKLIALVVTINIKPGFKDQFHGVHAGGCPRFQQRRARVPAVRRSPGQRG